MQAYYDLTFFSGPAHGWLRVPYELLAEIGLENDISSYSYRAGREVYLEEDEDAGQFKAVMREYPYCIVRYYTKNLNSEDIIRRMPAYKPISLTEYSVSLSLDVSVKAISDGYLWEEYVSDPAAFLRTLIEDGQWAIEGLQIEAL